MAKINLLNSDNVLQYPDEELIPYACYIDKNITVNVIKNGKSVEKKTLSLPKRLTNVIKCSNPRCICNNEDIDHIFTLTDDSGTYRCLYCETKAK